MHLSGLRNFVAGEKLIQRTIEVLQISALVLVKRKAEKDSAVFAEERCVSSDRNVSLLGKTCE